MTKIPEGFSTITSTLIVNGAAKAIDTYKKAFGATEVYRMETPDKKKIMHACLQIGDSKLFLCDAMPEWGCGTPSSSSFYVYLDNVDDAFKKAKQAGLEELSAVEDMFWGDRTGRLKDGFGNNWTLATHVRDVTDAEMEEARKKMAKKAA